MVHAGLNATVLTVLMTTCLAQTSANKPHASSATRDMMIQKAHLLEARGRADLALQAWQQVLLSDPKNAEALAGIARDRQAAGVQTPAVLAPGQTGAVNSNMAHAEPAKPKVAVKPVEPVKTQIAKPSVIVAKQVQTKQVSPKQAVPKQTTTQAASEKPSAAKPIEAPPLESVKLVAKSGTFPSEATRSSPEQAIAAAQLLVNRSDNRAETARALNAQLVELGERDDLSAVEHDQVQALWAAWSLRSAAAFMKDGHVAHAADILDAASQAFPDNLAVRTAAATAIARAGRSEQAVTLWKTLPLDGASSLDISVAVSAALGAHDQALAGVWVIEGLKRFPNDPSLLTLAGRYEQESGNDRMANDYYRAAAAAMPAGPASSVLPATAIRETQQQAPVFRIRANAEPQIAMRPMTAADLPHLLDPESVTKDNERAAQASVAKPAEHDESGPVVVLGRISTDAGQVHASSSDSSLSPRIFPASASQGQSPTAPVYSPVGDPQ